VANKTTDLLAPELSLPSAKYRLQRKGGVSLVRGHLKEDSRCFLGKINDRRRENRRSSWMILKHFCPPNDIPCEQRRVERPLIIFQPALRSESRWNAYFSDSARPSCLGISSENAVSESDVHQTDSSGGRGKEKDIQKYARFPCLPAHGMGLRSNIEICLITRGEFRMNPSDFRSTGVVALKELYLSSTNNVFLSLDRF
jgi:hypothetical protein